MTKLWAGGSSGLYGRCDAKCHLAQESTCTCICGGIYHGKALEDGGMEKADQFHQKALDYATEFANERGWEVKVVPPQPQQQRLF